MKFVIKRVFDIFFSLMFICIFFPIWLIVAILIKIESKGPVFYIHKRVGKNKKEFLCFKFRSMKVNSNPNELVKDSCDDRVTKVGHFLRASSLDETPQFLNVLLGQMSVIGPRPALPSQVEKFIESDFDKLLVKPGITGWTQVNGRNSVEYTKRMEMDCFYAKNWSLFMDLKILLKTPLAVLKTKDIYDVK